MKIVVGTLLIVVGTVISHHEKLGTIASTSNRPRCFWTTCQTRLSDQGCEHYGSELIENNTKVCHNYQALRGTQYQCCSKINNATAAPKNESTSEKTVGRDESGKCSWYGKDGEIPTGAITACQEQFDPNAMKVAHKTLPCGTKLCVRNINNGKIVNVTVNDRGPYARGRILDLTLAAFGVVENRDEMVFQCEYEIIKLEVDLKDKRFVHRKP